MLSFENKTSLEHNVSLANKRANKKTKSNLETLLEMLLQLQARQLSVVVINDSICIQQREACFYETFIFRDLDDLSFKLSLQVERREKRHFDRERSYSKFKSIAKKKLSNWHTLKSRKQNESIKKSNSNRSKWETRSWCRSKTLDKSNLKRNYQTSSQNSLSSRTWSTTNKRIVCDFFRNEKFIQYFTSHYSKSISRTSQSRYQRKLNSSTMRSNERSKFFVNWKDFSSSKNRWLLEKNLSNAKKTLQSFKRKRVETTSLKLDDKRSKIITKESTRKTKKSRLRSRKNDK